MPAAFTRTAAIVLAAAFALSCADSTPTAVEPPSAPVPSTERIAIPCTASVAEREVTCGEPVLPDGVSAEIIGSQNIYIKLTSSAVSYNSGTGIFQFNATVKNLSKESIGTPGCDGGWPCATLIPDPDGIRVFFHTAPVATGGSGTITVANADGVGNFTAANQPYFKYSEILDKDEVSAAKTWQLNVPNTVTTFTFSVYVEMEREYRLVINEVMANPGGAITDANGEWFEVYNAGTMPVNLSTLLIADSSAGGPSPYHVVTGSIVVPSGGYATLGANSNTVQNGGATIDYAYGSALSLDNAADAIKLSRVFGAQTITVDRAAWATEGISVRDGFSRELINPAANNVFVDSGAWSVARTTANYGTAGRGTPRAVNSEYNRVFDVLPINFEVASPMLTYSASCSHTTACTTLRLEGPGGAVLATTTNSTLSGTVSLAAYEGRQITISLVGIANGTSRVDRTVYVESSSNLELQGATSGEVRDFAGGRALYRRVNDVVSPFALRTFATSADQLITANTNGLRAFVTPHGALLSGFPAGLYELYDGVVSMIQVVVSSDMDVRGGYAQYSGPNLYWRDLNTGSTTTVAPPANVPRHSVASDGSTTYWTTDEYDIYWFRSGVLTRITNDPEPIRNTSSVTDGVNLVYRKKDENTGLYAIAMHDGVTETILAPYASYFDGVTTFPPEPGLGYLARGGWIVFRKPDGSNILQVWRRTPAGVLSQLTTFTQSAGIEELGTDGTVILGGPDAVGNIVRYRVGPAGGAPQVISGPKGTVVERSGNFYVLLGRKVFRILP